MDAANYWHDKYQEVRAQNDSKSLVVAAYGSALAAIAQNSGTLEQAQELALQAIHSQWSNMDAAGLI